MKGFFFVMVLCISLNTWAQDDPKSEHSAKGIIIEYEREGADNKASDTTKTNRRLVSQNKEVELILGGQSEDGVAKQIKIKVED